METGEWAQPKEGDNFAIGLDANYEPFPDRGDTETGPAQAHDEGGEAAASGSDVRSVAIPPEDIVASGVGMAVTNWHQQHSNAHGRSRDGDADPS